MGKTKYKIDGRELNLKICVYPGSFDPVTNGHLDIIHRSAMLCDRLVVAVVDGTPKTIYACTTCLRSNKVKTPSIVIFEIGILLIII
jgi:pantetheine-phosphate adenylyltransferase